MSGGVRRDGVAVWGGMWSGGVRREVEWWCVVRRRVSGRRWRVSLTHTPPSNRRSPTLLRVTAASGRAERARRRLADHRRLVVRGRPPRPGVVTAAGVARRRRAVAQQRGERALVARQPADGRGLEDAAARRRPGEAHSDREAACGKLGQRSSAKDAEGSGIITTSSERRDATTAARTPPEIWRGERREPTCEHRGARRRADVGARVPLREAHARRRERFEVRRRRGRRAVAAEVAVAQVIGEEDQEVGRARGGRCCHRRRSGRCCHRRR